MVYQLLVQISAGFVQGAVPITAAAAPLAAVTDSVMYPRIVYHRSVYTRSVYPRSVYPRAVHPRSVHPRSVHPRSVHPRSVHPRALCTLAQPCTATVRHNCITQVAKMISKMRSVPAF